MKVDGEITDDETTVFKRYVYECQLGEYENNNDVETSIKLLSKSSDKIKKIVYVELWGIIAADEKIKDTEVTLVNHIGSSIHLSEETRDKLRDWMQSFIDNVKTGCMLIAQ